MQWVARLATRMSFKAAQMVCKAVLNWAPAPETIEQVVLGMGREAAPFMKQLPAPPKDGNVLVIEVAGKCPPTATEAELALRGQAQIQLVAQPVAQAAHQHGLRVAQHGARRFRQLLGDLAGARQQRVLGQHFVDHAKGLGFLGRQPLAGEQVT